MTKEKLWVTKLDIVLQGTRWLRKVQKEFDVIFTDYGGYK